MQSSAAPSIPSPAPALAPAPVLAPATPNIALGYRPIIGYSQGQSPSDPSDDATQDRAIMRIGDNPVGVHSRNPAPITTRRRLSEARPETATPMGFQTQIGREILTVIGSPGHQVRVTSRNPDVLIGADTDRYRNDVLQIIAEDPNHPMRPIYDETTGDFVKPPYEHGDMQQWALHPYDWQSGHARSNRAGGADVIIFQTRYRNQEQSARLERHGSVTKDEVYIIGGIAVDKLSAWDLYQAGRLTLPDGQTPDSLPTMKL